MIASITDGRSLLLCGPTILPLVEKEDSEATVEIGMANMSFAIKHNVGYLTPFNFHQPNKSNS